MPSFLFGFFTEARPTLFPVLFEVFHTFYVGNNSCSFSCEGFGTILSSSFDIKGTLSSHFFCTLVISKGKIMGSVIEVERIERANKCKESEEDGSNF